MRIIDKSFAIRFRELRKSTALTQEQFLLVFNKKYNRAFTAAAISQYENGKRIPEIDALVDFADFFGVSVGFLLFLTYNQYAQFIVLYLCIPTNRTIYKNTFKSPLTTIQLYGNIASSRV